MLILKECHLIKEWVSLVDLSPGKSSLRGWRLSPAEHPSPYCLPTGTWHFHWPSQIDCSRHAHPTLRASHTNSSSANRWKGTTLHLIVSSVLFPLFLPDKHLLFFPLHLGGRNLGSNWQTLISSLSSSSVQTRPTDQTQLWAIFVMSRNASMFRSLGINLRPQSIFCSPTRELSIVISHPVVRGGRQRLEQSFISLMVAWSHSWIEDGRQHHI